MASPIKMAFMVKKYSLRIFKLDLIGRVSFEGTTISKYPPPNWVLLLLISISYRHHSWKFTASIPSKVRNYTLLFLSIALQIFYKWFVLWQPSVRWQAIKKLSNYVTQLILFFFFYLTHSWSHPGKKGYGATICWLQYTVIHGNIQGVSPPLFPPCFLGWGGTKGQ